MDNELNEETYEEETEETEHEPTHILIQRLEV